MRKTNKEATIRYYSSRYERENKHEHVSVFRNHKRMGISRTHVSKTRTLRCAGVFILGFELSGSGARVRPDGIGGGGSGGGGGAERQRRGERGGEGGAEPEPEGGAVAASVHSGGGASAAVVRTRLNDESACASTRKSGRDLL